MDLNFDNLRDLKIFTNFYIDEHDLTEDEKDILYEFVQEANEEQVKYLLFTGKMQEVVTQKDLNEVGIHQGFGHVGVSLSGAEAAVATGVAVALAARAAYRAFKDNFAKFGKQCSQYKHGHPERDKCEKQAKKKAIAAKIQAMNANISKVCPKSKDPQKCKAKIQNKISKAKKEMQSL
jgi:hypothetical protein